MINLDKPNVGVPQTELNIGDGYNLTIGGLFKLIIGAVGLGGMTNQAKASIGATWDTITTSWATETQTWTQASQLITNNTRTSSSIVNFDKP